MQLFSSSLPSLPSPLWSHKHRSRGRGKRRRRRTDVDGHWKSLEMASPDPHRCLPARGRRTESLKPLPSLAVAGGRLNFARPCDQQSQLSRCCRVTTGVASLRPRATVSSVPTGFNSIAARPRGHHVSTATGAVGQMSSNRGLGPGGSHFPLPYPHAPDNPLGVSQATGLRSRHAGMEPQLGRLGRRTPPWPAIGPRLLQQASTCCPPPPPPLSRLCFRCQSRTTTPGPAPSR
jgi:hypothetical protein